MLIIKKFQLLFLLLLFVVSSIYARVEVEKCTASSFENPSLGPEKAVDGNLSTRWASQWNDNEWITFDLGSTKNIIGVILKWENAYAKEYDILISQDGERWEKVYWTDSGDGGIDDIFFDSRKTRYVKLSGRKRGTGWGYSLWEVYIRGENDKEIKAEDIMAFTALDKIRGIVGWAGYKYRTFTGKDGSFGAEPHPHQVSFWVYDRRSKSLYIPEKLQTKWHLEKGGLPISIAEWKEDGIEVKSEVFAYLENSLNILLNFCRISIKNSDDESKDISLYSVIRQNPVPERTGEKEVREILFENKKIIKVNGKIGLFSKMGWENPVYNNQGLSDLKDINNIKLLSIGDKISESGGICTIHLTLKKGEKKDFDFIVPAGDTEIPPSKLSEYNYDDIRERVVKYWQNLINPELRVPDEKYQECFYASLYYILILMNGDELHPGPSAYNRFFLHDAVDMVHALDAVGLFSLSEKCLTHFDYKEGGGYLDELGGNIAAFWQHYLYSKDKNWLSMVYPKMIEKCNLIKRLRQPQLRPELKGDVIYGLLPASVSQDNWNYKAHLYVDDWWAILGLKGTLDASKILNKTEDTVWLEKEYTDLLKCTLESMEKARIREGGDYYPGFADYWQPSERKIDQEHRILGDTQMAWAHRPALFPGQSFGLKVPLDKFKKSYQKYWERAGKFSGYDGGWFVEYEGFFWGYNIKLAHPLIYIGLEDIALKSINWSFNNQSCPYGWMEAMPSRINEKGKREVDRDGGIVGDVPHGWVASHYILLLRNMLFREEDNKIVLLSCIPEEWFASGKVIEVRNFPTYFGEISFKIESHMDKKYIDLEINMPFPPENGYSLKLPPGKVKKIEENGMVSSEIKGDYFSLSPNCKKVKIIYY